MCKWSKWGDTRIDSCMRELIKNLKREGIKTLACCCGHGKYPQTIVIDSDEFYPLEICQGVYITRSRRFYKRDKQGIYYIPECVKGKKR